MNFDEHEFDELIVGFIGETLREIFSRKNFHKSLTADSSKFSTIKLLHYNYT